MESDLNIERSGTGPYGSDSQHRELTSPRLLWTPARTAAATITLATIVGLGYGILISRDWLRQIYFLRASFNGWPRPRALEWTTAFVARQQTIEPSIRYVEIVVWIIAFVAAVLLVRSLSADIPFILPGQSQRKGVRDWMTIWVDPRLVVRGIVAGLLSAWILGVPHLIAAEAIGNSETRKILFGGLRLALSSIQFPPRGVPEMQMLFIHWLTTSVLTSLLFVMWSSDGLFSSRPFDFILAVRPAVRGLLAGTAVSVLSMPFTTMGSEYEHAYVRAYGVLSGSAYVHVIIGTIIVATVSTAALTLVILSFSKLKRGGWMSLCAVLSVAAMALMQAAFYRSVLVGRLDFGKRLNDVVPLRRAPDQTPTRSAEFSGSASLSSLRRLAVLTGNPDNPARPPSVMMMWQTVEGLEFSEEATRRVQQFIRQRAYHTSLFRSAFVQLFNVSALNFDRTREFRVCLDNLEQHPAFSQSTRIGGRWVPQGAQLIAEMLPDMPATNENRQLLEEVCDERKFALDGADRFCSLLGDAWMRFGDTGRARKFYALARLPNEEIESRLSESNLKDGTVRGSVRVEGRPARGVSVGIVSTLRWLELMQFPNAFSLRVICAGTTTNDSGGFAVNHLPAGRAGEYYLVLIFPRELVRPEDEVQVKNQPGVIRIGTTYKPDLGVIEVRPAPKPSPGKQSQPSV